MARRTGCSALYPLGARQTIKWIAEIRLHSSALPYDREAERLRCPEIDTSSNSSRAASPRQVGRFGALQDVVLGGGEPQQRTEQVAELNHGLEARVAQQVEELGRVGRLKRFLAPQLAELIVSQDDKKILESHRREIVVVFCDLRGYTAFHRNS